jgi:Metallopeptidase family M24
VTVDTTPPTTTPITRESLGIPTLRDRYRIKRDITLNKINTLLLPAMRRHHIDMWIILDREYHPDPFATDLGGEGGVRNAHIFYDTGDRLEKIYIFSHPAREDLTTLLYDQLIPYGYRPEGLHPHLHDIVTQRNPRRIGLNMSPTLPMADGLTVELKKYLDNAIGPDLAARETTAELLARDFRATRLPEETHLYQQLVTWTIAWQHEGLSRTAITPGTTTSDDVHWWWREKAHDLGLDIASFLPGLRTIHEGRHLPANDQDEPIRPGDVLSIDAGLSMVGYHTDLKRMAYVLRPGETDAPASLKKAYRDARRMTDVLCQNMRPGRLGHEVWEMTTDWAAHQGYQIGYAMGTTDPDANRKPEVGVYCHSVGTSVHDIGARTSENNPHAFGDRVNYPLATNNWYSVELHVSTPIPEWDGLIVKCTIEETALLTDDGPQFLAPRQKDWILIPSD